MTDNLSLYIPERGSRFIYGDAIRILATIFVILLHATGLYIYTFSNSRGWWAVNAVDSFTRIAVPLFLGLSGALLLRPEKEEPILLFYKKRLNKILIPLLVWSFIYYLASVGWQFNKTVPKDFFIQFLQGTISYHLPFMYYLIGIYLIIPILRVYTRSAKKKELEFFLLIWFVSETCIKVIATFGLSVNSSLFQLVGFVGFPIMGYYISEYAHVSKQKAILFIATWIFTAVVTFFLSSKTQTLNESFFEYLAPNVIIMSFIAFTWIKDYDWGNSFLFHGVFGKLSLATSRISFTMYFIHPLILNILFEKSPGLLINKPVPGFIIIFLPTYLISWILAFLIDCLTDYIFQIITYRKERI